MNRARVVPLFFVSVVLLLFQPSTNVVFAVREDSRVITVARTEGYVDVKYGTSDRFVALSPGDAVGPGDAIRTDDESTVELTLPDRSAVKIGPSSQVLVKEAGTLEVTRVSRSVITLIKGKIRAVVKPLVNRESSFTIETNNATVGVRGTDFGVTYDPDDDTTYILGLTGCVTVRVRGEGENYYDLCQGKDILIVKGYSGTGPVDADRDTVNRFLKEMRFDEEAGSGPDESGTPYIADIFLNRSIDLRDGDGPITITRNDLDISGRITISGTAADEGHTISSVLVSLDGGMTWQNSTGTRLWSYTFVPVEGTQYDILVKAVNDRGVESDPHDLDPIAITFRDVGTEDIVREFIGAFVEGLRSGNTSGIREIISDDYDGSIGGYYSKDELIDEGIRDNITVAGSTVISYSVEQVGVIGTRIIGTTSWTASFLGKTETGTTKWWLSAEDNYSLIHSEGDWLLAGINPNGIVLAEGILIEEIDTGEPYPCHKGVSIYLTAPNIPAGVTSVIVSVGTYAPASWSGYTLTRSYYEAYTGIPVGFGGEVVLEYGGPPPTLSCAPIGFGDVGYDYINCSYNDYGYTFYESSTLVP